MKFSIFFKGMLMGICDLVPGISGGTIAFITGIYERLINSISGILKPSSLFEVLSISLSFNFKKINRVYQKYDLYFLFTLLLGIFVSIILGSKLITYLLNSFFVFTMSFFIGLILASAFLIFKEIDDHKISDRLFSLLGFIIGVLLLFLIPATVKINSSYIILSGFLGVSAMFLPGISGSYILYLLGSYQFLLQAVNQFFFRTLLLFLVGAVLGAYLISNIIFFLLKHYHSRTLYFLFGFVLGALLVPLRDIVYSGIYGFDYIISVLLFLIGFILVFVASKLGRNL